MLPLRKLLHGAWSSEELPGGGCLCCNGSILGEIDLSARVETGLARVKRRLDPLTPEGRYLFLADYAEELITFLLAPQYVIPLLKGCVA